MGAPTFSKTSANPPLRVLSNGTYSVMLSENGSGFSRWRDASVTRWREDVTRDCWGSYLLLRDEDGGALWSPTRQPFGGATSMADADSGRALFSRVDQAVESTLEIAVAAEADIELRRLTLHNRSEQARTLSLTSYTELVIGPTGGDNAHPAFSKMFVQTEWDAQHRMLLATRRRREPHEAQIWAAHALHIQGQPVDQTLEYETDRARFLGRGRGLRNAQAMQPGVALSNTTGCVLDPVFSLRQRFTLEANSSIQLLLWTQLSDSRDGALALTARLGDAEAAETLFRGAALRASSEQDRLGIDAAKAQRFAHWLSALLVSDRSQRGAPELLARGRGGPPMLWSAGISGDRPLLVLSLGDEALEAQVDEVLLAQRFWRSQRIGVDVVLLNGADGGKGDTLQTILQTKVKEQQAQFAADANAVKAELFLLRSTAITDALRDGLQTAARIWLDGGDSTGDRADAIAFAAPLSTPIRASVPVSVQQESIADSLEFENGFGGFSRDGRAYEIRLEENQPTPAPWINVIANADFGTLVSTEGGGYTFSVNSQQNAITPWPNDPVSDSPHEVIYLRDRDEQTLWSATALPIRVSGADYRVTHDKGWSTFCNDAHGIDLELTVCVPVADPIKLSRLRLRNRGTRARRLTITGYVAWALGANGTTPAPFVITSRDETTGALLARNRWREDFAERVAFFDLAGQQHSISGDRGEFLGALGAVDQPAALQSDAPLSGRTGAGLDPCGALQTEIELPPQTQIDLVFLLGDAQSESEAQALITKYRVMGVEQVLAEVAAQWNGVLDAVQVRTPDRAMDILLNDWLLYQVLGCRVWARTAYYQASGAYGFRDQLQDVMALCVSRPDVAREQILRAAGRQFPIGDVQHWWLPPSGKGVRTKMTDDRVWLAYVAAHYVRTSGDAGVLDETTPFLVDNPIPSGATEAFFQPTQSDRNASLYEHCALAIDVSLTRGAHGLPLIGTGDWNDGMNAVGEQGRGESAWLGWFLLASIDAFAPHAEQRGDAARAARWRDYAGELRDALEQAWDGQWYRRGYYDDGAPLGSRESDECRIDTIAQSWSVIAGSANGAHASEAMDSVDRLLVDRPNGIAKLFTPPFDRSRENPGYIKGYPPGVRENGGQYTHGATWSIFAWAMLGDGDRAEELFGLLNPIRHSDSAEAASRYKVEPYAVCADVYSVGTLTGRGGWTWYTGSAAWLYRAGLEAVLGFQLRGDQLRIDPCIPKHWPGFEITYLRRAAQHTTTYRIRVENPKQVCRGVIRLQLDAEVLTDVETVPLADDGNVHTLHVVLG